ncbi:E3 ubiquitin-protein ligase-like protein [Salvia divinorum]|uniref:RING-type E3 ubiquitin transferase n=1 Tax=Salvia divinorum TaxID=28513 RepID=A0ABD1H5D3_SALDI
MVAEENSSRSPGISGNPSKKRQEIVENGQNDESLFSPGFRSVAAMAGWDEEALLVASLIVEDTPDRQFKQKKRTDLQSLKTPPTNSRRKRRAQRRSPASIPVTILDLDEDEPKSKQEGESTSKEETAIAEVEKHSKVDEEVDAKSSGVSSSTPSIPCLDRLREELSCAICLEICYEPSTTPCGHSFCKKCLSSAADRCGRKCPKCRQIISTGKYCKVNTVLWNTVQLLFPQEVEARKAADESATETLEEPSQSRTRSQHTRRSRRVVELRSLESSNNSAETRRNHEQPEQRIRNRPQSSRGDVARTELPGQDRDAALALRLQREEFMEAFTGPEDWRGGSLAPATARANLRAMASRAINIRMSRGRRD